MQLLVNWQETPQQVTVALPGQCDQISVITEANGTKTGMAVADHCITLEVPALNALMIDGLPAVHG